MRGIQLLALTLALPGCTNGPQPGTPGVTYARIGETVTVDGPQVTPLRVLEDSRCPVNVDCAWPGQVRLEVRIGLGGKSEVRELNSIRPEPVADGTLDLAEITPDNRTDSGPEPSEYRFGFTFSGGL
jgi:hypothetical protein